jgi:predicted PurR-regulated permease PerM
MVKETPPSGSPTWGSTTKTVVGLTIVAFVAALLIQFRGIIGPLILAFMLAFLLYPIAAAMTRHFKLPWRMSVNIIYLVLVIILAGLFTIAGLAIVQQIQSLIGFIQGFIPNLPNIVSEVSKQSYQIGPFAVDFSKLNLLDLANRAVSTVQPLFGQITSLISSFATSAGVTLGWSLFVIVISYFLLAESTSLQGAIVKIEIPGYDSDIRRMGSELRKIWNAFLRGQLIIILLVILVYSVLLFVLGLRFAFGIALLAGLAKFIPYIGPFIAWMTAFLVAYTQGGNYFGMQPLFYGLMVVVICIVVDQILDQLVTPRFMGQTLGLHPAAVLVSAIVATNLIGIIGLVLAAPVLATITLISRYVLRKMLDLDPWPPSDVEIRPLEFPLRRWLYRLRAWLRQAFRKV